MSISSFLELKTFCLFFLILLASAARGSWCVLSTLRNSVFGMYLPGFLKTTVVMLLIGSAADGYGQTTATGDHVRVRWLAPAALEAEKTTVIGFYFVVDPHWHVYWHNPGDSGAAPKFDIQADGASVDSVLWPFPTRLPIEHLTNLGYEGNVAYLLPVTSVADAEQVSLSVNLEWLVCKVDCIPGFGQMSLSLPVRDQTQWSPEEKQLRDFFLQRVPSAISGTAEVNVALWEASLAAVGAEAVELRLVSTTGNAHGEPPEVFPMAGEFLTASEPLRTKTATGYVYRFSRVPGATLPQSLGFVLVEGERATHLSNVSFERPTVVVDESSQNSGEQSLWVLLLAAFAGGVILNLMPCVFPVLSIKLFGLVQSSSNKRISEGMAYGAGVLVTFAALGGLLLALRAGGAAMGWGFQLQSAPVVLSLIILFWLMALSFSGVFEFGHKLMSLAGSHQGGSFVTGVLAVFVAAPCTGPFMGAALGAAAVLPAAQALLIFLSLGAGLAAPFVLLCVCPPLLNRLPKPGAWMETLRQLLAFPLYATVIWLLWVLGKLVGDDGWLIGCSVLLLLVFSIWLNKQGRRSSIDDDRSGLFTWHRIAVAVSLLILMLTLIFAFMNLTPSGEKKVNSVNTSSWQGFNSELINQARADGRAVFIDYTAAWCITCQVNKKLVLDTAPVLELFKRNEVLLIRADWTQHDDEITQSLAALGRNSVPVYAWYPAGENNVVLLPQVLRESMIEELF